jgi:hypothetical protein
VIVYHTNQGSPLNVFTSIYEIARRDTQLGEESVSDAIAVNQILYTAPTDLNGFGRPFIAKLTGSSAIIYVRAVGSDFTLDDGTPITEVFGITIPDGTILLGEEELPAIVIYYDYTNVNGEGFAAFDENGDEICTPDFVLLGHELSHASHMIDGDEPEDISEAHATITIPEENLIREEHGLSLRDPENDDVVSPSAACASPAAGGSSCFVLTAALGMERHDPIAALHALRQRLLGPTRFGALFYAALRREYYSFAPALADDVRREDSLRAAVRRAVIEPFLAYAAALERYLATGQATQHSSHATGSSSAELLGRLASRLRGGPAQLGSAPSGFDQLTAFLESGIAAACGPAPFTAWAVFEPARLWLESAGEPAAIEDWLGDIPVPDRYFSLTDNALKRELETASALGLFSGPAGRTLAARMAAEFRRRGRSVAADRAAAAGRNTGARSWRS